MYIQDSSTNGAVKPPRLNSEVPTEVGNKARKGLLIVNSRSLERECLSQALQSHQIRLEVIDVPSVEMWRMIKDQCPPLGAVLYNLGAGKVTDLECTNRIHKLTVELGNIPVVILADTDEFTQVLKALELGVKGYIPASVHIGVCAEAIELAVAGGIFVPASCMLAVKHLIETGTCGARELTDMFTPRQAEVVKALRKGKANKIIAFDLDLRQSTVKVHIRNIMKKLKATNRTEVVYKINALYPAEQPVGSGDQLSLS
ncbi:response regulator transcription factor [Corticibacterium sp. UT-5YL-CI-8]|nr:response regulator transcription factor [Tianweitania sp. UT-5YL-CI-8]